MSTAKDTRGKRVKAFFLFCVLFWALDVKAISNLRYSESIYDQLEYWSYFNYVKADSIYSVIKHGESGELSQGQKNSIRFYKSSRFHDKRNIVAAAALLDTIIAESEPQSCTWQKAKILKARSMLHKADLTLVDFELRDIDSTSICDEAQFFYHWITAIIYTEKGEEEELFDLMSVWPSYFERFPELESIYCNNLGHYYNSRREFETSRRYFLKNLNYAETHDYGPIFLCISYLHLMNEYNTVFLFDSTLYYVDRYMELDSIYEINDTLMLIGAKGYAARAYYFTKQYQDAAISLFETESIWEEAYEAKQEKALSEAEAKYNFLEEEAEKIKAHAEADRLALERQRLIVIGVVVVLIAIVALFITLWRAAKRQQLLLEKEGEIDLLMQNQEILAMEARMQGGRKERDRLGRDLHDRVGAMLSTAKLAISSLQGKGSGDIANRQLESTQSLIDETISEVRKVSHNILASASEGFVFEEIIDSFVSRIRESGKIEVNCIFDLNGYEIKGEMSEALYRVILELFSNTLKYAKASEVNLNFVKREDGLSIVYEDNGIGFDLKKKRSGIGLQNINQRIVEIGGEVHIDSSIELGTTVIIDLPLILHDR